MSNRATIAALDAWVAKINRMAAEIEEDASILHPSAWKEILASDHARFRELAGNGPDEPMQPSFWE